MGDIPKGAALYLHSAKGDYSCRSCPEFIPESYRCVVHGLSDYIAPEDSCGLFVPGLPGSFGFVPLGCVNKGESGYTAAVNGASCKRCKAWMKEGWDCAVVDKDSKGDDPGIIHPDACCCLWTRDPVRGDMTSAQIMGDSDATY